MNGARKPKRLSDESLITWWCGGETKILTPRTIAHLFSSLWRLSGGKNRLSLGPKGPPHPTAITKDLGLETHFVS